MSFERLTVLIPALKKTVAFQDDLVKKLAGITLIQRAIDKAVELGVTREEIHLLTDSEEIRLIAERNGVGCYWEPGLILNVKLLGSKVYRYLGRAAKASDYTVVLSPYAPLLPVELIRRAVKTLGENQQDVLKPIKEIRRQQLFDLDGQNDIETIFEVSHEAYKVESRAFMVLESQVISSMRKHSPQVMMWDVGEGVFEIASFQDWWVCEKLLQRKRIVFRVVGSKEIGMGHIYRALTLAHEITDHEVRFVCDEESLVATNKLAGYDYWLGVYPKSEILEKIIELAPDVVVNDILNTAKEDVETLRKHGIHVMNFEDLGAGAQYADCTVNELYDEAVIPGERIHWGHKYFILRDEFQGARRHRFSQKVQSLLITFGGTDQNDLTRKTLRSILPYCKKEGIKVYVVTGGGYPYINELEEEIAYLQGVDIEYSHATGVMSHIMEKSQIAITSNGRTVYELAHMNIPAIVISHHEREQTHLFANEENGFLPVGVYQGDKTLRDVCSLLEELVENHSLREEMFSKTAKFNFGKNKEKVIKMITHCLDG